MKFVYAISILSIAVLLGCGGMGAYVPDQAATNGTPVQCAALDMFTNVEVITTPNNEQLENLEVVNGVVDGLQSRAPGEAVVNLTASGMPIGMTVVFSTNPVTVQLDDLESIFVTYETDGSVQLGTYNIAIEAQQSGCSPIVEQVSVEVRNGNTQFLKGE